jgi:hypothetical protein
MSHPIMFRDDDPVLNRLREVCLSLPGAAEKISHGRPNFFTRKVFAVYGGGVKIAPGVHESHDNALLFMAEAGELQALDDDPRFFVPAYYGPYGWRGTDLTLDETDWTEVRELIDASFRLTATKKLIAELEAR